VIAQISARAGKKYTLTNDRSITANEVTYSNFWGKIVHYSTWQRKQVLLSARQKLTTTGSRLHIKAIAATDKTEKDWDTTRTRSTTSDDTTTQTPQPQHLPIRNNVLS
jgi:hypothetical protein